jgi:hypothetical protein
MKKFDLGYFLTLWFAAVVIVLHVIAIIFKLCIL